MDAKERAKKIADIYCPSATHKSDKFCPLEDSIAAQIEEACFDAQTEMYWNDKKIKDLIEEAERDISNHAAWMQGEAVKNAYEDGTRHPHIDVWNEAKAEGFRAGLNEKASIARPDAYCEGFCAAREKAKGIAEKGPPPGSVVHCNGDVRDPGVVVTGYLKWIAQYIGEMEP